MKVDDRSSAPVPRSFGCHGSWPQLDAAVEHVLVHTGQNYDYELNEIFFDDLGLRQPGPLSRSRWRTRPPTPSARSSREVDAMLRAERSGRAAGPRRYQQLSRRHPGETAAAFRSFTWRRATAASIRACPEEINRRIVDHISRHQPPLQRHRPGVPASRGTAAGSDHQDRQSDVRGAGALRVRHRTARPASRLGLDSRMNTSS